MKPIFVFLLLFSSTCYSQVDIESIRFEYSPTFGNSLKIYISKLNDSIQVISTFDDKIIKRVISSEEYEEIYNSILKINPKDVLKKSNWITIDGSYISLKFNNSRGGIIEYSFVGIGKEKLKEYENYYIAVKTLLNLTKNEISIVVDNDAYKKH